VAVVSDVYVTVIEGEITVYAKEKISVEVVMDTDKDFDYVFERLQEDPDIKVVNLKEKNEKNRGSNRAS
jgi:hypothetical protein